MKLPRLLFVVTEDWYFVSHRLPLAVAARKAGFDVAVATRVHEHGEQIVAADIRLIPFELSRQSGNPFSEVFRLIRLYRLEQPTIVHHVALKPVLFGTLAARLARVPFIVNAIAGLGWLFSSSGRLAKFMRPWVRLVLTRLLAAPNVRTIVQNPDDHALLVHAGLQPTQLRLIRGAGVDVNTFTPALAAPPLPVTVMLVARMLWDKGVGELMVAAQRLHAQGLDARFVLVGDPDPANPASIPLAQLREWHGHNGVEWWGRREEMPAVLRQAHIACLPSFYGEGLPKSLLEAAACGLPIVTTDAPGYREVVSDHDNGFLVPIRDPLALADALKKLILDPALRQRMGQRSRAKALAAFSQDQVIADTLRVYQERLA
jgi:glycosyltransferase involved in cell wall biosynthesis